MRPMALVDWQAVVLDLQAHVRTKNSHGQRELTDLIIDLMEKHRIEEGLPERMFRLYAEDVQDALSRTPSLNGAAGSGEMADRLTAS